MAATRKAVDLRPLDAETVSLHAVYLIEAGRPADALAFLEPYAGSVTPDLDVLTALGMAQACTGSREGALATFARARQLDPSNAMVLVNAGTVHLMAGDRVRARQAFETALDLDDGLARAHNSLGVIAAEERRLPEAIVRWQRAAALDPADYRTLFNLGSTMWGMGREAEARPYLEASYATTSAASWTVMWKRGMGSRSCRPSRSTPPWVSRRWSRIVREAVPHPSERCVPFRSRRRASPARLVRSLPPRWTMWSGAFARPEGPSLGHMPLFFAVRQTFDRPRVEDLAAAVPGELEKVLPAGSTRAGARIAVTVGSRGIRDIAAVVRTAVDFLKSRGARPFVLPAMGCHGGATAEGQRQLIAHYGVTEEAMGCPVRAEMETRSLGRTASGVEVRVAETAWQSDGVLLVNRVKPHTDYKGPLESGLVKICAIGLGKYDGAREIHRHLFTLGLGPAIRGVAEKLVETGRVLGGLAILENAYHETAKVVGVPARSLFETEEELLARARQLTGRLPLDELDVLVCDRLGKNISGTGLDTNIIGRSIYGYTPGQPWCDGMPRILRIAVMDLSDESDGNAVGMGLVDFVPERFMRQVDHGVTRLNSLTSCSPAGAKTPVVLPDDREAILAAIRTSPLRPEGPRVAYVRDTLELEHVLVSEACRPLVERRDGTEIVSGPSPLRFDGDGRLLSPFA